MTGGAGVVGTESSLADGEGGCVPTKTSQPESLPPSDCVRTPSASMAVMLAISDAIALALLEAKGVTREDYGLRHHGGYLGRAARTDNEPHQ